VPSFAVQALGMALVPLSGGFWPACSLAAAVIGLGNGIGSGTMMTLGVGPGAARHDGGVPRRVAPDRRCRLHGRPGVVGAVADALTLPARHAGDRAPALARRRVRLGRARDARRAA
jgi:hypothetical protein